MMGWLPDPERHPLWPGISALLEPAAKQGGCPVFEDGDLVWIVADQDRQIIGAVTTRGLDTGDAELVHVGGTRIRLWAGALEAEICKWARANNAPRIVAAGRKGWKPIVEPLGWHVVKNMDGVTYYAKEL